MQARTGSWLGSLAACMVATLGFQGCTAHSPGSTGGPTRSIQQASPTTIHHIALRASNGQYVVAEGGGGKEVNANRNEVGPWELFTFVDLNGGQLESGDVVNIRARNGMYLVAEDGGGREVNANRTAPGPWERFTIIGHNEKAIVYGDKVSLRANNGPYVVAEGGGGREVKADRNVIGPWEKFTLYFDARHTKPPINYVYWWIQR